ncbi:MAG: ASKHA domain-containing protein [Proteobacteria bacterium]|nr:ASKHA domain-containing protein [Pseudomonadota bacterium]
MDKSAETVDHCQVVFQPVGRRVAVSPDMTLLEAGRTAGLVLSANCGGIGVCGRCRVQILEGRMDEPGESEHYCLSKEDLSAGTRLACRARIRTDVSVHVPAGFMSGTQRLQTDGEHAALECDPMIERRDITLPQPAAKSCPADLTRLAGELSLRLGPRLWAARPEAVAQLSLLARKDPCALTVYLNGGDILGFSALRRPAVGIAVDLGCTKIAGYLIDLHSGRQLGAGGIANPQISYGEDLITRLVYALQGSGEAERMARVVREAIDSVGRDLCRQADIDPREVVDLCVVGNTAMMHLLLQLPIEQLLHAPFIAAFDGDMNVDAMSLGLRYAPGARVHILPSIGGFVGADHVAMILAHDIDRRQQAVIGIDVGTNTEIVLYEPKRKLMLNTSVPSGPAFEGGHIHDGMRAAAGAIEKVSAHRGNLSFKTVDSGQPVGLCGSGVVDLVAQLWRTGRVNDRGHLLRTDPRVRKGEQGMEYLVVPASQSGHGRDIVFTQGDVSEVQLAKAAIYAGIASLLEIAGLRADEVGDLIVAGAFGSHLDLESAVDIGALPRLRNARYAQVGNAAGVGAKMALVSCKARARARSIAAGATRIELKDHPNFNRILARATRFPVSGQTTPSEEIKPSETT